MELLTARETLSLFCELRGVVRSRVRTHIDDLLEGLQLSMNKSNMVKNYSGGNKRKLMAAVALIGEPEVVFLDEPSAGMDPEARRSMWDILQDVKSRGISIVLTTHSMEEAEALADKMCVFHLGRMRCLGSVPQLKKKFSKGYELQIKYFKPQKDELKMSMDSLGLPSDSKCAIHVVQNVINRFFPNMTFESMQNRGSGRHVAGSM